MSAAALFEYIVVTSIVVTRFEDAVILVRVITERTTDVITSLDMLEFAVEREVVLDVVQVVDDEDDALEEEDIKDDEAVLDVLQVVDDEDDALEGDGIKDDEDDERIVPKFEERTLLLLATLRIADLVLKTLEELVLIETGSGPVPRYIYPK